MASSRPVAPELATIEIHGTTRQAFILKSTLAAGAAYGAMSIGPLLSQAFAEGGGDVDILNFALTLEYLEAEFYTEAAKKVGGLSEYEKKLTRELRDNENEHIDALAATIKSLGGKAVAKPTFAFGGSFGSRASYLKLANTLEDTGVSAYNGAAPMIESGDVLAAAGGIVQIEARHAALIRIVRKRPPAPVAFDKASDMEEVLAAVKPLIAA